MQAKIVVSLRAKQQKTELIEGDGQPATLHNHAAYAVRAIVDFAIEAR